MFYKGFRVNFGISSLFGITWTRKTYSHGTPYCLYASGGQFVLCTLYGVNVFRRPEYDAPLPILTPRLGTTYIKAL